MHLLFYLLLHAAPEAGINAILLKEAVVIATLRNAAVRQRGDDRVSINTPMLYPCGEGAGYAGGIMSAAVDGIRVAEYILGKTDS